MSPRAGLRVSRRPVAFVAAALALGACSDGPLVTSAPGPAQLDVAAASAAGALTVIARGGQQCPTARTTAVVLHVGPAGTVRRWEAEVNAGGTATFPSGSLPPAGSRVLVFWEPNLAANLAAQRDGFSNALYAPFDVEGAEVSELAQRPNCLPVIFDPALGNNSGLKTGARLDALVGEALDGTFASRAWVVLGASAQTLQPMTLGSGPGGALIRLSVVDAQGQTVPFGGTAFGLQAASGFPNLARLVYAPEELAAGTPASFREWYRGLQGALLMVQGDPAGFYTTPGAYVVEIKDRVSRRSAVSAGFAAAGGTVDGRALLVPSVAFSFDLRDHQPPAGQATLPYARAGWELDVAGNRTPVIQVLWNQEGNGTVDVTVEERARTGGTRSTAYQVRCEGAGCVQPNTRRPIILSDWNAATRVGTVSLPHPGSDRTETACVTLRIGGRELRPAYTQTDFDPGRWCANPNSAFLRIAPQGTGGTFRIIG